MSICARVEEGGQHIKVRCSGCGSLHHTKNIGSIDPETHAVHADRSLFDITPCQCLDAHMFHLVHVCGIDCSEDDVMPEEKEAILQKYNALLDNNVQRASIFLGFALDVETWMCIQKYNSELAKSLLFGNVTEDEKDIRKRVK